MDAIQTAGKRCKNRTPRVRLSWAARLSILESEETVRAMPARQRRDLLAECRAMRKRMEGRCCSVVWFEDFWAQGGNYAEIKQPSRWHAMHVEYPPPAENTPMLGCECFTCRKLKRLWPNGYVKTARRSYECFVEAQSERFWRLLPGAISTILRERDARRGWVTPEVSEPEFPR